jgi:DNA (cytosine-5)-methyltransferase 1
LGQIQLRAAQASFERGSPLKTLKNLRDRSAIRYCSVCTGIGAATVGLARLAWELAWVSEIERFACEVVTHHHPRILNLGDMTTIAARVLSGEVEAPQVLVGGTPCQSFSVSGLRRGLTDPCGQLTLSYVQLFIAINIVRSLLGMLPAFCLWENVCGVLADKTNGFGCLLAGLAGEPRPLLPEGGRRWPDAGVVAGPERTVVWRVLDSQFLGTAQRRRRVYVVAGAGAPVERIAEILLEIGGLPRLLAEGKELREEAAAEAGGCAEGDDPVGVVNNEIPAMGAGSHPAAEAGKSGAASTVARPVLYENHGQDSRVTECPNVAPTICRKYGTGGNNVPLVRCGNIVRYLTPTECERLQGLPDGYTDIPGAKDAPRYRALGNSFTVPAVGWIGKRLDSLLREITKGFILGELIAVVAIILVLVALGHGFGWW